MTTRTLAIALTFTIQLLATGALGQAAEPKPKIDADTSKDDILLLVNVTAKELKMDVVPSTKVEFPGTPRRTTMWVTERQNLPEKLEPGVTYRNIGIQLRISSRFEDIEQIVKEALGEVPITDSVSGGSADQKAVPAPAARRTTRPVQAVRRIPKRQP